MSGNATQLSGLTKHLACPKCGSPMNSNGVVRWLCTNCGYSPLKCHHAPERPDYTKRAPCPVCGAYYGMILDPQRYHCGGCGKQYQKDWQEKLTIIQHDKLTKAQEEPIILVDFQEANIGGGADTL